MAGGIVKGPQMLLGRTALEIAAGYRTRLEALQARVELVKGELGEAEKELASLERCLRDTLEQLALEVKREVAARRRRSFERKAV